MNYNLVVLIPQLDSKLLEGKHTAFYSTHYGILYIEGAQ